jgi:hypothetical protein
MPFSSHFALAAAVFFVIEASVSRLMSTSNSLPRTVSRTASSAFSLMKPMAWSASPSSGAGDLLADLENFAKIAELRPTRPSSRRAPPFFFSTSSLLLEVLQPDLRLEVDERLLVAVCADSMLLASASLANAFR